MFEQSLLEIAAQGPSRRPWTLAVSSLLQCVLVGIMVLVPMLYTEAVPRKQPSTPLLPPPRPFVGPSQGQRVVRIVKTEREPPGLVAPNKIPRQITILEEDSAPPALTSGLEKWGVPGGTEDGSRDTVLWSMLKSSPAAPPPPKPETPRAPVRVGGDVQEGKAIHRPSPVYPPLARQARIQGTVVLEAIITKSGTIESLKVVEGHPMLVSAALEAVRQWRYRPTLLNGEPVEVATTIDVSFTLSQ